MCMDIFFCGGKNTLTDIIRKKNSEIQRIITFLMGDFLEYKFMQMVVPENVCTY